MITAMQMMLDDLISKRETYENAKMYQCVATLETSIELAEYLLEKEKEQMLLFANWCRIHDSNHRNEVWMIGQLFDKYNNEKFNQKK